MAADPIKIEGLDQFIRNLKTLDASLPKMARLAFNSAAQLVVDDAVPHIPHRTGRAARSVRTTSTQRQARVSGGGARAKYYPWLDFGGKRAGRGGGIAERPFYTDGRFIYASYFALRKSGKFVSVMVEALLDVVRQAGLAVD